MGVIIGLVGFVAVDLLAAYQFRGQAEASIEGLWTAITTISNRIEMGDREARKLIRELRTQYRTDMNALYRYQIERDKACQQR